MSNGRYRYNYNGFYEKFTYPRLINRKRNNITKGAHESFVRIFLISSLSFLVESIEEDIQSFGDCVDITRGWTIEPLQELF